MALRLTRRIRDAARPMRRGDLSPQSIDSQKDTFTAMDKMGFLDPVADARCVSTCGVVLAEWRNTKTRTR